MFLFLEVQYHVEAFLAENKSRMIQSGQDDPTDMVPLWAGKPIPEDLLLIIDILHEYSSFFPLNSTAVTIPISVTLDWCTPKVKVLVDLLANYHARTPSFQGIIFVEQRQMASTLAKILPAIPELSGKIKCAFIVGEGVNREGVSKQTDKFSGNPVQLFRERIVNIRTFAGLISDNAAQSFSSNCYICGRRRFRLSCAYSLITICTYFS